MARREEGADSPGEADEHRRRHNPHGEDGVRTPEAAVQRTITDAAYAGERVLSVARIVFALVAGIRSGWMWAATSYAQGHEAERAWIVFPWIAVAIGFSIAVLCGLGRRRHTELILRLSVSLDAIVVFAGLLPNALWPAAEYQGLPRMLDTALLPTLAVAAGLRLSPGAAILSGILHGVSFTILVLVDRAVSGDSVPSQVGHYTMYAILLAAAVALALLIAVRTRRLAERGARAAVAADQAGRGLRDLLRDHHDLRSVISSAQINADLVARGTSDGAAHADAVHNLRADLGEVRLQIDHVKRRALEELAGLEALQSAPVDDAAAAVVSAMTPRFPAVAITAMADGAPAVLIAGGEVTLRRILANLVVNACEGDGRHGARRVDVHARKSGARVAIEVVDDGPGFPGHVLATPPGHAPSTKAAGTGLGIGLVDGLVKASGGTVTWRNRDGGGAHVVVELPVAG
jgi:signal transduction histidine kinase